jgi:hypothetical protein
MNYDHLFENLLKEKNRKFQTQQSRPASSGNSVFSRSHWLFDLGLVKSPAVEVTTIDASELLAQDVLSSLKNWVEETTLPLPIAEKIVEFPGGEIAMVNPSNDLGTSIDLGLSSVDSRPSISTKILFVLKVSEGTDVSSPDYENSESFQLFLKMIQAMKLLTSEYKIHLIDELSAEKVQLVKDDVARFHPGFVVTFGGAITSSLLNKKERLERVHGKFFQGVLNAQSFAPIKTIIVPVFHPDYLLVNAAMKRTAWNDLQKILQHFSLV